MATLNKSIPPMTVDPRRAGGLSLLIVEDDDADAYLIFRALLSHPAVARVTHAPNGEEALRMLREGEVSPDIAFVDLSMPVKDGFSLMTELGGDGATFPVVVLTSSSSPTDAMKSRLRSAVRVIVKPESVPLLEKALSSAIDSLCPRVSASRSRRENAVLTSKLQFSGIDEFGDDVLG